MKKILIILIITACYLSSVQALDSDSDGVDDGMDLCSNTDLTESVPTMKILKNRYALIDGDITFDTKEVKCKKCNNKKTKRKNNMFTTIDTYGCSCEQILASSYKKWKGLWKFGCTKGVIQRFIKKHTPIDNDNDGYLAQNGDCDDNNALINPGMNETCDSVDNNCDGTIDEGCVMCNGFLPNDPEVCSGNGQCNIDGVCECNQDYSGVNCETHTAIQCFGVEHTDQSVCTGHGMCVGEDECQCDAQWSGPQCENYEWFCNGYFSFDPFVCNEHGTCVSEDNCVCEPGYKGTNCQFQIIEDIECYGYMSDEPDVCSGRGNCIDFDQCECETGYYGDLCEMAYSCNGLDYFNPNVCSGRGDCIGLDICLCQIGFYGDNCEMVSA